MYKGGNSRSYVILATNPKTDITLFKSNDSFEVNWTTFGKKKESTALIGYALVKVANCKKKNLNLKIFILKMIFDIQTFIGLLVNNHQHLYIILLMMNNLLFV